MIESGPGLGLGGWSTGAAATARRMGASRADQPQVKIGLGGRATRAIRCPPLLARHRLERLNFRRNMARTISYFSTSTRTASASSIPTCSAITSCVNRHDDYPIVTRCHKGSGGSADKICDTRQQVAVPIAGNLRIVQFTLPGSGTSVTFGQGLTGRRGLPLT